MIRKAQAGEAEAVRGVVLSAYERYVAVIGRAPGPMLDDHALRIAADQVWVLEEADGIAGVLVLEDGPAGFLLDNIAVRPDRQGRGFGRSLLDFAEAKAARCGCDSISLYTNALMVENIAIYTARGYRERKRRREKGFERVYMEKRLA
jgi:GNAT superfamily N-acetyltransferase